MIVSTSTLMAPGRRANAALLRGMLRSSDVRDVVMTYASLLSEPKAIGQTFNICSGKAHSLGDVITTIQDISNFEFSIEINPAFVRENEVRMLWGDRSKLDATIIRQPMRELQETLTWMLGEN